MIKNTLQNVNGVLLLDKPSGISSNKALMKVKKIFNARKAGHAGTLDPIATGILPIMFGEATKYATFGLNSYKKYEATLFLGVKTSTGDSEGQIIKRKSFQSDVSKVKSVLKSFLGEQMQIPPMFSALKFNGKPLYKYARDGLVIDRKPRQVMIEEIKFISLKKQILVIEIICSKGTYIRTLAEDIGEKLDSFAHLVELRRLKLGNIFLKDCFSFEKLEQICKSKQDLIKKTLLPIETLIFDLPPFFLNEMEKNLFVNGRKITIESGLKREFKTKLVRVYDHCSKFIGTGSIVENKNLQPERLISNN